MKGGATLALICKAFCRLDARGHKRPFEKEFSIKIGPDDTSPEVDFRDLCRSQSFRSIGCLPTAQDTSAQEHLVQMNEAYEDAVKSIESKDTYEQFNEAVINRLKEQGTYGLFENYRKSLNKFHNKSLQLDISTQDMQPEILHAVFRLMSGWCESLDISFDGEKAEKILRAYEILDISGEKETDIFMDNDGKPLHLRIKQSNLFCINFVYLLKKYGIFGIYYEQAIYKDYKTVDSETKHKRVQKNSVFIQFRNLPQLPAYLRLLKLEMDEDFVSRLYLCSGSHYFVYKMQLIENCKIIRLQHENDSSSDYTRLDLVDVLNSLNSPGISKRLEILTPFFDSSAEKECRWGERFEIPGGFYQSFHGYLDFMAIPLGVTEVYINSLMSNIEKRPLTGGICEAFASVDDGDVHLVWTVKTALRTITGLTGLVIQGFNKFPEELVPLLQKTPLEKFGVMSFYGIVDYVVNNRIFREECALKKSIRHFVGHYSALYLLSYYYETWMINTATLLDRLYGGKIAYCSDENEDWEEIKKFFENENSNGMIVVRAGERVKIDTVYHMEKSVLSLPLRKTRFRNVNGRMSVFDDAVNIIYPFEILERFEINRLFISEKLLLYHLFIGYAKEYPQCAANQLIPIQQHLGLN
ncbi:hypothetical protein ENBRE01_2020 [Enteropsectra breve]|nr:hypothetical protein ENBRE01_2020 [Enteropsectra breve]